MPPKPQAQPQKAAFSLPFVYRLFFLFIEPVSALVGAYYAHFQQRDYLLLTDSSSAPVLTPIPTGTSIVLSQLANLYLLFALNEALVLRSTSDLRVWKTVLFVLLLADLGHLYSIKALGLEVYLPWNFMKWNAIDWGNIPLRLSGRNNEDCIPRRCGHGHDKQEGHQAQERLNTKICPNNSFLTLLHGPALANEH